jgi:hypothetical protein
MSCKLVVRDFVDQFLVYYRTHVCEAIAKCNARIEAIESDMIMAIYLFEISTMTRLGKIDFSSIFSCDLAF